jgi:OFA family oxalate/formate antiporter-like MFS transporter
VRPQRPWAAIAAATVLNLPLGSIYAFSVFLEPIEAELGLNRSDMSLVFAIASVGFTVGMLLVPIAFGRMSAATLVGLSGVAGVVGVALSAAANGLGVLLLGYSVLFGIGGGATYIVAQQSANLLITRNRGLVNGYITGLYPAGAMLSAPLFGWCNVALGYRTTLGFLAFVLLVASLASVVLLSYSGVVLPRRAAGGADTKGRTAIFIRMWTLFFLAAAAGLTVLSQAAGIIAAYGGTTALALTATTAITGAVAVARLSGGWLTDRFAVPHVCAGAHGFALAGAVLLTFFPSPLVAAVALAMVAMGHGFISGATASGIALYWPASAFGRIASQLYIGWCVAAISLPLLAGYLFDLTHGYGTAVVIAGCGNLVGAVVSLGLPKGRV